MYIKKNDQKKMILGGVVLIAVALFFAYTNIPGVKDKVNSYLPFGEKTEKTVEVNNTTNQTQTTGTTSERPYVVVRGTYYYEVDALTRAYNKQDGTINQDEYVSAKEELEGLISEYLRKKAKAEREKINQGKAVIIEIRSDIAGFNNGAYVKQGFSNLKDKDAILRDFVSNTASWQTGEKARITLPGGRQIIPTKMSSNEIKKAYNSAGVECVIYEVKQYEINKAKEYYTDSNKFDIKK